MATQTTPTEVNTTEKTPGQHLDHLIADARQKYDQLNVQMHLAGMEAREEWEGMQDRWRQFCDDCERVKAAADESGQKIDGSFDSVANEFRAAFDRIAKEIKS